MKRSGGVTWQHILFSSLAVSGILTINRDRAFAQVIPDGTLGNESSRVNAINSQQDQIEGGATRGANLFHSFREFNINEGKGVYFANPGGVENIFSRVTGNNRSEILGTLGVNGAANLFLINPNGILFGENALLDVQGSFAATIADGIKFGDRNSFSASQPEQSTLVSVAPSAFFFNAVANQRGNILNLSSANGFGLQVALGKNITLVGGGVIFDGGSLTAPGGRVELGGLTAAGEVGINSDNSLSFPNDVTRADVSANNSFVNVSLAGTGNININARNLELSNSFLVGGSVQGLGTPEVPTGDIKLNATEKVRIEGNQPIASTILNNAGNIIINTGTLEGLGNFNINSISLGELNSGDITITATDKVSLVGTINNTTFIASIPNQSAQGNAGNITITTPSLSLSNISIGASSNGQGDAGNIQINTNDSISFSNSLITASSLGVGNAGNITIESQNGDVLFDTTPVGAFAFPALGILEGGTSGDITIKGRSLFFTNGAQLIADNDGQNNAGNINIEASKDVILSDGSLIFSNTGGQGNAGSVNVSALSLSINSGGRISANTFGDGNGGNITINASETISINGIKNSPSAIASEVRQTGKGNAGEVKITTKNLSVTNGGTISTSTTGAGNGGNIVINASETTSLDGKNIVPSAIVSAAAGTGKKTAGGIEINTKKLFVNNEAEINAINLLEGDAGNIEINSDQFFLDRGAKVGTLNTGKGNAGNISITASDIFSATNDSFISSNIGQINGTPAEGKAGNIEIAAKNVSLTEGSQLQAAFQPNTKGESGSVSVKATDSISFDGFNTGIATTVLPTAIANGSNIKLEAKSISIVNGAGLNASSIGIGNAGNIEVSADSLTLENNSSISAFNTPSADISNTLSGGNLNLKIADNLILRNSDISTQASSNANGGNIDIAASAVIAFADSDIFAFAQEGKGGNISLNTPAYFGSSFTSASEIKPNTSNNFFNNNNRADINATGAVSGVVSIPDVSFIQNSLVDLPDNAINTENLIANSCVVRSRQQEGKFIITGAGGLPESPTDNSISPYPTGEIRTTKNSDRSWKKGDLIIEPQGVYELENGKAIVSRECSQ